MFLISSNQNLTFTHQNTLHCLIPLQRHTDSSISSFLIYSFLNKQKITVPDNILCIILICLTDKLYFFVQSKLVSIVLFGSQWTVILISFPCPPCLSMSFWAGSHALGHCTEHGVVTTNARSVLVVVRLRVTHLIKFRL